MCSFEIRVEGCPVRLPSLKEVGDDFIKSSVWTFPDSKSTIGICVLDQRCRTTDVCESIENKRRNGAEYRLVIST